MRRRARTAFWLAAALFLVILDGFAAVALGVYWREAFGPGYIVPDRSKFTCTAGKV